MPDAEPQKNISLDDALHLAKLQMNAGNYNAAVLILNDIIKTSPEHFETLHLFGISKYHIGDVSGAIHALQSATSLPEANGECFCNLGIFLTAQAKYDEAISAFTRSADLSPDKADPWWNLSNAYLLMQDYVAAKKAAITALEINDQAIEALLNLGVAEINLGDIQKAIQVWERALGIKDNYLPAMINLSDAYRSRKWLNKAEEMAEKILAVEPHNLHGLHNLASVYLDRGDYDAAEQGYEKVIARAPEFVKAHISLAKCFYRQAKFEKALTAVKYAMAFDKENIEAHRVLFDVLYATSDFMSVHDHIKTSVVRFPKDNALKLRYAQVLLHFENTIEASVILSQIDRQTASAEELIELSRMYERTANLDAALNVVRAAIEKQPDLPNAYIRLGQVYHLLHDIDQAEGAYKQALEINAAHESAYLSLAELEQTRGDTDASLNYVRKALKVNPKSASAYLLMSKAKTFNALDKDFKAMVELEKTLADPQLKSEVNYALFKAYDDMGDVNQAFKALQKANTLAGRYMPDTPERQSKLHESMKSLFLSKPQNDFEGRGYESDIPIFILGMPRSGTTLTEQIIGMHPHAYAAGELFLFGQAEKEYGGVPTRDNATDIGKWYVEELLNLCPAGEEPKRITNKIPGNYMNIGHILRCLPKAKIIHCYRDPLDTCFSCYRQNFLMGHVWSYDLEALAHQYNLYQDMMAFWHEQFPDRIFDFSYEDLVQDFDTQAQKLIDFINLDWSADCLRPQDLNRPIFTASKMQARRPVYASSVGIAKKYKKHLSQLIENLDGENLET